MISSFVTLEKTVQEKATLRNTDAIILAENIFQREQLKKRHPHTCQCSEYCLVRYKYVIAKFELSRAMKVLNRYPADSGTQAYWDQVHRIEMCRFEVNRLQKITVETLDRLYPIDIHTLAS